jgi:hypothetical protein
MKQCAVKALHVVGSFYAAHDTIIGGLNLDVVVFGICCSFALNRTLRFSCHEKSHPPLHALFGADKPKKEKFGSEIWYSSTVVFFIRHTSIFNQHNKTRLPSAHNKD